MKKSPEKKLDRFKVESAAFEVKAKLEFLDFGLHQNAFQWNEDAIAGAASIVNDIQGELKILTKYFYQTWRQIYHSDQQRENTTTTSPSLGLLIPKMQGLKSMELHLALWSLKNKMKAVENIGQAISANVRAAEKIMLDYESGSVM